MLIGYNYIGSRAITFPKNFSSKTVLLALDWSYQELLTMMYDLNHTLVLVGVTFRGLKTML